MAKTIDLIDGVVTTHAAQDAADAALQTAQSVLDHAEADAEAADTKLAADLNRSGPIVDTRGPTPVVYAASIGAPGYKATAARGLDAEVTPEPTTVPTDPGPVS